MLKVIFYTLSAFILLFAILYVSDSGWETADRSTAKIAPLPSTHPPAVLQVYSAKLWGWRGLFADHTWLSTKKALADSYTVYEVLGWRKWSKQYDSVLRVEPDIPDRLWYGNQPKILLDLRGKKAEHLIKKVQKSALSYPYKTEYSMIFGPNSNTWTAWVACQIPELNLKLSSRAIGKNFVKKCL